MIRHRIKELRETHNESQRQLGEAIGRDKSVVSKWESGAVHVDLEMAGRIAKHYGVPLASVLDLEGEVSNASNGAAEGFSEDCQSYEPPPTGPLSAIAAGPHHYSFTILTDVLRNIGIHKGDVVVIDDSAEAVAAVKPLQAVQVNWRDPVDGRSRLLMRQFVPPSLLITNAPSNLPSIDMSQNDSAHIVGVVISAHRTFLI